MPLENFIGTGTDSAERRANWVGADYAAQEERVLGNTDHLPMIAEHRLTPNPFEYRAYLNTTYATPPSAARVNYPTQNDCAAVDEVNEWMGTAWVAPAMGTPASEANAPRPWTTLGAVAGRASSYIRNFAESISTATTSVRQLEITAFTDAEFTAFKTKAARICDQQIGRSGRANFSLGVNALTLMRLDVTIRNQSENQFSAQQSVDGQMTLFGRPVKIVNSIPNGHVEAILDSDYRNAIDIYQAQREAVSARSNSNTELRAI